MKILFGVFEWGLGHMTRSSPVISALLKRGHTVDVVATGRALVALREQFGTQCIYFDVPGVTSPYTSNSLLPIKFVAVIPQMLNDLRKAHKIVRKIIDAGKYDKIISDCRYDVYDKISNSYLINHQLRFKSIKPAELALERWLSERMKKYKYVFVPDYEKNSLTEQLSHNLIFFPRGRIKFVGILSRISKRKARKDVDYLVLLTGPEPQRRVLEKKMLEQLKTLKGKIVIGAGKPEVHTINEGRITYYSFINKKQQENFMNRAKCIITRSGYTSVMDICQIDCKKVLMIPTPGQPEQVYLGKLYEDRKTFHVVSQNKLNLSHDVKRLEEYTGFQPEWKTKVSVKKILDLIQA